MPWTKVIALRYAEFCSSVNPIRYPDMKSDKTNFAVMGKTAILWEMTKRDFRMRTIA